MLEDFSRNLHLLLLRLLSSAVSPSPGLDFFLQSLRARKNATKRGPKKAPKGKVVGALAQVRLAHLAAVAWKKKCSDLLLVLAGQQGLAYDVGACTMALRVTLGLVERATLTWDSENKKIKSLEPIFSEASALTMVSVPKLKELFEH